MLPLNPLEHQNSIKILYGKCVETVCDKHQITRMELDILLFLANNPLFDTAADMVEIRCLSKSQVSASVKLLEQKGLLQKEYREGNRKTAHLVIRPKAAGLIADGKAAQETFLSILCRGIPEEDLETVRRCNLHMLQNIRQYIQGGSD